MMMESYYVVYDGQQFCIEPVVGFRILGIQFCDTAAIAIETDQPMERERYNVIARVATQT